MMTAENSSHSHQQSPFVEVIYKRLRTLKKRLSKLERYDNELQKSDPSKFNQDQLKAIQKKNDVRAVVEELEELLPQFSAIELEESKSRKKLLKEQELQTKDLINEAIKATKVENEQLLKDILKLNTVLYKVLPTVSHKLPKEDCSILNSFKEQINPSEISDEEKLYQAVQSVQKLYEKSNDEAFTSENSGSVSYSHIHTLTTSLITNVINEKTGEVSTEELRVEEKDVETATYVSDHAEAEPESSAELNNVYNRLPLSAISFMQASEIDDFKNPTESTFIHEHEHTSNIQSYSHADSFGLETVSTVNDFETDKQSTLAGDADVLFGSFKDELKKAELFQSEEMDPGYKVRNEESPREGQQNHYQGQGHRRGGRGGYYNRRGGYYSHSNYHNNDQNGDFNKGQKQHRGNYHNGPKPSYGGGNRGRGSYRGRYSNGHNYRRHYNGSNQPDSLAQEPNMPEFIENPST